MEREVFEEAKLSPSDYELLKEIPPITHEYMAWGQAYRVVFYLGIAKHKYSIRQYNRYFAPREESLKCAKFQKEIERVALIPLSDITAMYPYEFGSVVYNGIVSRLSDALIERLPVVEC